MPVLADYTYLDEETGEVYSLYEIMKIKNKNRKDRALYLTEELQIEIVKFEGMFEAIKKRLIDDDKTELFGKLISGLTSKQNIKLLEKKLEIIKFWWKKGTDFFGPCPCCGETRFEFLDIHHRNGDGKERRDMGEPTGVALLKKFDKKGWPLQLRNDYVIICLKCHRSLEKFHYCPDHGIEYNYNFYYPPLSATPPEKAYVPPEPCPIHPAVQPPGGDTKVCQTQQEIGTGASTS